MRLSDLEGEHTHLRAVIATIDREVSMLASKGLLSSSWAELVELLALGPAPLVRECPVCKHTGRREATRCGYCWTKLSPQSRCGIAQIGGIATQ